jgi:hypothetical protein
MAGEPHPVRALLVEEVDRSILRGRRASRQRGNGDQRGALAAADRCAAGAKCVEPSEDRITRGLRSSLQLRLEVDQACFRSRRNRAVDVLPILVLVRLRRELAAEPNASMSPNQSRVLRRLWPRAGHSCLRSSSGDSDAPLVDALHTPLLLLFDECDVVSTK